MKARFAGFAAFLGCFCAKRFTRFARFAPFNYHALIFIVSVALVSLYNGYFWEILASQDFGLRVAIFCAYVLILCLALEILSARICVKFVLCVILAIAALAAYFIDSLQIGINKDIIQALLNTNASEAGDYLSPSFFAHIALFGVLPCVIVGFAPLRKYPLKTGVAQKIAVILGLSCLIAGLYAVQGRSIVWAFKGSNAIWVLNPIAPIRAAIIYAQHCYTLPKTYRFVGLDATTSARNKIFVMVIGESQRAANYALNGYPRETNPYTGEIAAGKIAAGGGGLINFSNFHSCGVITAISVPCMLSDYTQKTYNHRDLASFSDTLLDVAQRAGFRVFWFSNNGGDCIAGVCRNLAREDIFYFNGEALDSDMLGLIERKMGEIQGNALVIIHLRGSHGPRYDLRYGGDFEVFTPVCRDNNLSKCDSEAIVNAYDNSILATDFFVAKVIEMLENRANAGLWFISDHGESLGERGNYMHGGLPFSLAPREQKHIASMLWLGRGFEHSVGAEELRRIRGVELNHDFVFHTMLGLLEIRTNAYDRALDIATLAENAAK